jgi:hypothetical protein
MFFQRKFHFVASEEVGVLWNYCSEFQQSFNNHATTVCYDPVCGVEGSTRIRGKFCLS